MRKINIIRWLALTLLLVPTGMSAQSTDMENDSISANEVKADSVDIESLSGISIDSIIDNLKEFESVDLSPNPRYAIVTKDGKMGIFDMTRLKKVTEIEYNDIWFSIRTTSENGNMTLFRFKQADKFGVLGINETDNSLSSIYFTIPDMEE